jgi:hypothetical protein
MIIMNLDRLLRRVEELDSKFSLIALDSMVLHPKIYNRLFDDLPKTYCRSSLADLQSVKVICERFLPENKIFLFDRDGNIIGVLEVEGCTK